MTSPETQTQWQYLEKRPQPWRQQLYLKGRKLRAFTVWMSMIVNEMTPEETADNWELPQGERILIPPTAEECAKNHPNAKNFVVEKMS